MGDKSDSSLATAKCENSVVEGTPWQLLPDEHSVIVLEDEYTAVKSSKRNYVRNVVAIVQPHNSALTHI